jgi:hypothetical protein
MSRSYRKPFFTDGYKGSGRRQFFKNYANRVIRRLPIDEEISNGRSYRKYTDPWDICDYKWYWHPEPRVRVNGWTGELEEYPGDAEEFWKVCRK